MYAAGTIAAAVYNANPFRGENAKVIDPLDFVPDWKKRKTPEVQSAEEQIRILTKIMGSGPGMKMKAN
ncbi:MAG TPA: hypothetical protein VKT80_02900 [Chloroflexota bacterium]|nr:hypothetical protein [Chloroflexota bacterium]